jgi:hypothetical protein
MRTGHFAPMAAALLIASGTLAMGLAGISGATATSATSPASEAMSPQPPAAALDTTGISGSRPGCVPRASAGSATSTGDVRPEDAVAPSPNPHPRTPRIVEDVTVGSGSDTGAGGNRSFPRGATGSAKANDC